MNNQVGTDQFINELERVAQVRSEISICLSKTGFPEFMGALNTFLTRERANQRYNELTDA